MLRRTAAGLDGKCWGLSREIDYLKTPHAILEKREKRGGKSQYRAASQLVFWAGGGKLTFGDI